VNQRLAVGREHGDLGFDGFSYAVIESVGQRAEGMSA
jgi:hypothetical protein